MSDHADKTVRTQPQPKQAQQPDLESLQHEQPSVFNVLKLATSATPPPPDALPHAQVLQLQRAVGNQATIEILQHAPGSRLQRDLSDEQVAQAMAYYESRAEAYPSLLIRRIQAAARVRITGRMNEATVQGIARLVQSREQLPTNRSVATERFSNGILSPEEMVDIVGVGMERREERTAYVREATEAANDWSNQATEGDEEGTIQARLRVLLPMINERMLDAVPDVRMEAHDSLGAANAEFEKTFWVVRVSRNALLTPQLSSTLVNHLYHEARHAEQRFLALCYDMHIASNGITGSRGFWGTSYQGWPDNVQGAAREEGVAVLNSSPSVMGMGRRFHHVYFTREAEHSVENHLRGPTQALCAARQAVQDDPTPANNTRLQDAQQAFNAAQQEYANWWNEQDSRFVGGLVEAEFRRLNPNAPIGNSTPDVAGMCNE